MNWNRGLLRVWLAGAVLWAVAVAGYGALDLRGRPPAQGPYSYSAAKQAFLPQQLAVTDEVLDDGVKRGVIARIELDDGTILFAPQDLGEAKLQAITQRFHDERWWRQAEAMKPWALVALLPPLGILLAGALVSWILRGFRPGAVTAAAAEEAASAPVPSAAVAAGAEGQTPNPAPEGGKQDGKAGWNSSSSSLPPFIRSLGPVQRRGRPPVRAGQPVR